MSDTRVVIPVDEQRVREIAVEVAIEVAVAASRAQAQTAALAAIDANALSPDRVKAFLDGAEIRDA